MENYKNFDGYRQKLLGDVYKQPPDAGHTAITREYLDWTSFNLANFSTGGLSVLDVGCGQGFCKLMFEGMDVSWTGVTTGKDYEACKRKNLPVFDQDMSFLQFEDRSFDMVFARHVLEHSPYPLMTLFEWHRVARSYLLVVVPAPEFYGYGGRNHYSVFNKAQWWTLFTRSGWKIKAEKTITTHSREFLDNYLPEEKDRSVVIYPGAPRKMEYWYVLEKGEERIE